MKHIYIALILAILFAGSCFASYSDYTGLVRTFGDQSSWMTSAFVIADGSWVVTTSDAVTEYISQGIERTVKDPIFISYYTGQSWQCEVAAVNKKLNIALLKLPVSGLPATSFAKDDEFAKASIGTLGQITSGEPVGNQWQADIYGITRETKANTSVLSVGEWSSKKVMIAEMDDYRWAFISDITPIEKIPNGAMLTRPSGVAGMHVGRLVITGGNSDIVFGRCATSFEMVKYLSSRGIEASLLRESRKADIKRPEQSAKAFQLQAMIYSAFGMGMANQVDEHAKQLVEILPDDAQALLLYANTLIANNKLEDAITQLDKAEKINSDLIGLAVAKSVALSGLDKKEEAEKVLLEAEKKHPNDIGINLSLAEYYFADNRDLDKALSYAKKVVNLDNTAPAKLMFLADVYLAKKEYQNAINTIGEALKLAPEWHVAWVGLGIAFETAGDKTNAEKTYRAYVARNPKSLEAKLTLASFLIDTQKKDEAQQIINEAKESNPSDIYMQRIQELQDAIDDKEPEKEKPADDTKKDDDK
ncbi:MAG: tetratricopeptide repeat protein [Armatimonadota bacterium]